MTRRISVAVLAGPGAEDNLYLLEDDLLANRRRRMAEQLEIGDFLPDFQLPDQRGAATVLSRKMLGKVGVLLV